MRPGPKPQSSTRCPECAKRGRPWSNVKPPHWPMCYRCYADALRVDLFQAYWHTLKDDGLTPSERFAKAILMSAKANITYDRVVLYHAHSSTSRFRRADYLAQQRTEGGTAGADTRAPQAAQG